MDILAHDPLLYWLLWTIATLIGVLLGWTLRAQWREKAVIAAYEESEQERNSIAHLFSQIKAQHDQKTAELRRISLEFNLLEEKLSALQLSAATQHANQKAELAELEKAQAIATYAEEKIVLLKENIQYLRMRDQQQSTEIQRMHGELHDNNKNRTKIKELESQLQALQDQCIHLENERIEWSGKMEQQKLEIAQLQKSLSHLNAMAEGDSDQRDLTYPSGHLDEDE